MALSNAERQRRWRKAHAEEAHARLEAYKVKKARGKAEKAAATECDHEDRGVRVLGLYCGKCRGIFTFMPGQRESAHEEWLSSSPKDA